jgi:hypothetical protein
MPTPPKVRVAPACGHSGQHLRTPAAAQKLLEGSPASTTRCPPPPAPADETVYTLTVPSSDWSVLTQALDVLSEMAFHIR